MDNIVALAKRRGFIYPSSEIYGGLANTWDFGHYGVLLKNNLRDLWLKKFVLDRSDIILLDTSVILNPKVWEASGHVAGFSDALVDCKNCRYRTRADHLIENKLKNIKVEGLSPEKLTKIIQDNKLKCPHCGKSDFTEVRRFNLLFPTHIGILQESKSLAYLRGELAQGIFLNFRNVLDTIRVKIPFGIASQGIAFRNEITMGQSVFRTLQFDLMEFEYFIEEKEWKKHYEYWQKEMWKFAKKLGLNEKKLRWREHEEYERSHYSKKTMDIEYEFPFGWKEIWGLAYRTDYDLRNHMEKSGKDLTYKDQKTGKSFIPHVIEPTFGLSRLVFTLMIDSFKEEKVGDSLRTLMSFDPRIAPVKVAVFPLQKDDKLKGIAKDIFVDLKKDFVVEFDDSGNIGKMYRRQDEIGTPFCVTVDYQTAQDKSVTVRDRDSMKQERVKANSLKEYFKNKLKVDFN